MRSLRSTCVLLAAICFTALAASAQQPVRGIFVTPIPNQPLTAIVTMERTTTLPDGKTHSMHTEHLIARNTQGEIYNELRAYVPDSITSLPPLLSVRVYDPQTRLSIMITPQTKTAVQRHLQGPPSSVPPDFYAVPNATSVERPSDYVKEEDLGWQKMLDLNVHGIRETQTIPASVGGQEIAIVDEYWYSDDVRLNLLVKHTDPRSISTVQTVTVLKRADPEASLFVIPADYQISRPGTYQPPQAGTVRTPLGATSFVPVPSVPISPNQTSQY